ncbi:hypothetical protein [Polyangium fumosum]|uniref:Uncharacterized protein n=1 Tax=Polyangium fumosum TaxID=889272 RepID=A0A4U1J4S5_9BACT|nr:hypothetical protein [Polyangium fumosum]TKD02237.1 hypothetical protein E8A74_29115 [Polyangium fumosum]
MPMQDLVQTFHDRFGILPPEGMLPTGPLRPFDGTATLVGSEVAHAHGVALAQDEIGPFLRTAPEGYLLVGFWGHGVQSHAFYYVRVDAQSRVYFRLPHGGVYMDNERAAQRIRVFLTRYFAIEPVLRTRTTSFVAVDAMGEARYRLVGKDGTKVELDRSLLVDASFEERFAPVLPPPAPRDVS